MRKAGSAAAKRHVDLDQVLRSALLASVFVRVNSKLLQPSAVIP
jgi:hypothetical protein